jgi:putative ABC transport system substrate-binding protein
MDRRVFIASLAALLPAVASGQATRVPRIGYLLLQPVSNPPTRERQAFLDGLKELGHVPGTTVEIVYASAENEAEFLDDVARDLVRRKPAVIVASGAAAVLAAKRATAEIPIVALALGDPIGTGAVRSLGRPEGNLTGVSFISSDLAGKRVQLIVELVPHARKVAVLWDSRNANARAESAATLAAIEGLGMVGVPAIAKYESSLPEAFGPIVKARPDALYVVFEGGRTAGSRTAIAEFAIRERLPLVSGWSFLTEAGGLASYAPDLPALFRRSASYVDRLLRGAAPRDLPFEQATTVELVINLKTAKALGITIPRSLLLRADRTIQ